MGNYPDPRNRAAFDWYIDHNPADQASADALRDESSFWLAWLNQQQQGLDRKRRAFGTRLSRGAVRWGSMAAAFGGLVALGATGVGAPMAVFGAAVTITNEVDGYRQDRKQDAVDEVRKRVRCRIVALCLAEAARTRACRPVNHNLLPCDAACPAAAAS